MTPHRWPLAGVLARYFGEESAGPIEQWPADLLARWQRDALAEQLTHVGQHSAFYQQKFADAGVQAGDFSQLSDLARFPFTTKKELLRNPWTLLAVPRDQVRLIHTSTGTTGGDWSYLLYDWDDMHGRDVATAPRLLMPVRQGDVVLNALPYEMSSSGQSFQRSLQAGFGATIIPVGKGGFYSDPLKTVEIFRDLKVEVLITTPPYALLLWEAAQRAGLKLGEHLQPRFMWITGEGCSAAYRRRLQELWNCPALVFYGSMECGSIGIESLAQDGCHVSAGQVYIEIIDPSSGQPAAPGQVGEIVCTVLHRKAAPLIRFRTGDLGLLDHTPSLSGIQLPRLMVRGRIVDQLAPPGQAATGVSPYMIEEVLYSHAAMGNNYQLYADGDRLLIDGECQFDCASAEATAARQAILQTLAQRRIEADLRWVAHIPRTPGKTRRLRPLADRESVMSQPCLLPKA